MLSSELELVSLFLTYPVLVLSISILIIWGKGGINALTKKNKTPMDWLTLGILFGFINKIVNNIYWAYMLTNVVKFDNKIENGLFMSCNMILIQSMAIIAGYCHIRSYQEATGMKASDILTWTVALVLAIIYSVVFCLPL